ncbi:MAG TPA: hypothetical protein VFB78_12755 [Acidimicrobiales bacterium]|nr:hypothetical protein [Acidimicrobiales bacterium]
MVTSVHRFIPAVVYLAAASVALHATGVAGFRAGWLIVAVALIGGATILVLRRLPADDPGRWMWLASALILALTSTAWLVDHAPLSGSRVASLSRAIRPDFALVASVKRSGHSSCRPHCPRVEEELRLPDLQPAAVILGVAAKMRLAGLLNDLLAVGNRHPSQRLRVVSARAITDVRAQRDGDGTVVRIVVTARRGRASGRQQIQTAEATSARTR